MTRARDLADSADKDIAGTLTLDGLTVDGDAVINDTIPQLQLMESDTTDVNSVLKTTAGQFRIQTINDAANSTTNRFIIDHATGDISFYEDTGTTAKFFWDASAESLGIGGTPDKLVHLKTSVNNTAVLRIESTATDSYPHLSLKNDAREYQLTAHGPLGDVFTIYDGTAGSHRFVISSSGNVGIGTSSPSTALDVTGDITFGDGHTIGDGAGDNLTIQSSSGENIVIRADGGVLTFGETSSEYSRFDSSGNLLVGKTAVDTNVNGVELLSTGKVNARVAEGPALDIRRASGSASEYIAVFRDSSTGMIKIGETGNAGFIEGATGDTGLKFEGAHIRPRDNQADADNAVDLGNSSFRFDDIYATNGTINTSDRNEKQQITSLTTAEMDAAKAISQLFKTFKWNDSVADKGDAARTHTGVIAQEVEQAMTDAGLSANNYAFFISTTWWETQTEVPAIEAVAEVTETTTDEDGNEVVTVVTEAVEARDAYTRTDTYETAEEAPEGATERNRKGIRYTELLSFIGAATEQRLASIELRLAALEAE